MRFLIIIAFLFMSSITQAQERPIKLKENEALSGTFSQKRFLSGFGHPITSEGEFYFDRAQGLVWKTTSPFETELQINKTGMSQSVDGQETIQVSTNQFPALKTLHDVLSLSMQGQWDILEEKFGAKLTPLETGWSLSFQAPKDAPFKSIYLEGAKHLKKLIIVKPEDDKDVINFNNQTVLQVK